MQLTVLQWNVWFKENIGRVVEVLKTIDADVICLQELTNGYVDQNHENTWEYIQNQLGLYCQVQEIPIITENSQWLQANAIFSRYPLEGRLAKWLHAPAHDEDVNDQHRGYLETVVSTGELDLTVATTHLSFTIDPEHDRELQELLALVEAKPKRYILTGDLNAVPGSQRVRELSERLQHAGPSFSEKTWTTKPFAFKDFAATTLDWRYDYIFTSHDIRVVDAKTIATEVSDHLPVLATIELP